MDKFFSFFGKSVLVVGILGAIAYGAYYVGKSTSPTSSSTAVSTTVAPTTKPTTDPGLEPESLPENFKPSKTITAGLGPDSGLNFTKYLLIVPNGWTPDHVTTNEGTWVDTLTLTKGTAQLKIFQAATGGAMCLYPGDADFEGPSSRYDTYVDVTTTDGIVLRRGSTGVSPKGFSVCQKGTENFGQPTIFGHMSFTSTSPLDATTTAEVDAMLASLKKVN